MSADNQLRWMTEGEIRHAKNTHFVAGMVAGAGAIVILMLFLIFSPIID